MSITIIAEAGVNHNGSAALARQMADTAKQAGADYVKYQTFIPNQLVSTYARKAEYQKKTSGFNESQLQMLERLALSWTDFMDLKKHCDKIGIGFLSTPFDIESIVFLETLDMDFWKVPSGEMTNLPYLEAIGQTKRKVILSTGMCELGEIQEAVDVLESSGSKDITILHCNTEYPTPFEDVNLRAMKQISEIFHKPVGYSDHTIGIEIPIAAAALGATVIEKHFTLDRTLAGPDHTASLEPAELASMVRSVRNIERALGNGEKKCTESERKNCTAARKSIVAKHPIRAGEILDEKNLSVKRPGNGISPMRWHEIIGQIATRDYQSDELIDNMQDLKI